MLVLVVELLNSAIEAAVDRMGKRPHELAGRAKDMGSTAVFLAIGLALLVWGQVLGARVRSPEAARASACARPCGRGENSGARGEAAQAESV